MDTSLGVPGSVNSEGHTPCLAAAVAWNLERGVSYTTTKVEEAAPHLSLLWGKRYCDSKCLSVIAGNAQATVPMVVADAKRCSLESGPGQNVVHVFEPLGCGMTARCALVHQASSNARVREAGELHARRLAARLAHISEARGSGLTRRCLPRDCSNAAPGCPAAPLWCARIG